MVKISIIIATRNEEKNIGCCLQSILSSDFYPSSSVEMIVVDNHSTDKTCNLARDLGAKVSSIGPERSTQRNLGAEKARGEYLLFLDADMELEKEIISECLNQTQKGYQVVIISEKIIPSGFWSRCRALEKECYLGDDLIEAPRFFEKKIFWQLGGYDEKLIASEDWDLTQRTRKNNIKIGRTKSFVLHHEKETNPFQAALKKYYYGLNLAFYLKKHPKLALTQYQPLRPAFLRHYQLLAHHPFLTLGLIILKFFEYAGGALGIIRGKLNDKP